MRKSLALRMPAERLFFMSMTVGLPAPVAIATWSKPSSARVLERERAAEADAAEDPDACAPREREVDQEQEVLVPAHGDAVLAHAAEPAADAVGERLLERAPLADRPEARRPRSLAGSGSIFRPSIADDAEALVREVVRQRVAGRTEADDQHLLAVVAGAGTAAAR